MSLMWTTLELAKKQVGVPLADTDRDDWLRGKLEEAESLVIAYLQTIPTPTPPDANIRLAILLQFAELWRFRGDDLDGDAPASRIPGALSVQVERCLYPHRPPSFA